MFYRRFVFAFCAIVITVMLPSFLSAQSQRGSARGGQTLETQPLDDPLPSDIKVRAFIHRPRVIEPNHLGTCTPSTSNPTDYELAGWHLPTGGIKWKLNSSTVPTNIANAFPALDASFATWEAVDSAIKFDYDGTTAAKNARFDGTNAVLWRRLSPWTIAVTYVWYYTSTHEVAEIDMVFNKRYPWAIFPAGSDCQSSPDAYDLQGIATHEIGHWVGLDDIPDAIDADLTMYAYGAGGELKKRTLAAGDIAGATAAAP